MQAGDSPEPVPVQEQAPFPVPLGQLPPGQREPTRRLSSPYAAASPRSLVVLDRGYNDYELFGSRTRTGVFFVTHLKAAASYKVNGNLRLPQNRNILADQLIELAGLDAQQKCPFGLRRIVVWDPQKRETLELLTNHLEFGSTTIAAIFKDRWQIELFFKALKQNLKGKTFVGTRPNALFIQIWTALTAMLLLKYLQFRPRFGWSLSNLVALLRWNLFTYRDLWDGIHSPSERFRLRCPSLSVTSMPFASIRFQNIFTISILFLSQVYPVKVN